MLPLREVWTARAIDRIDFGSWVELELRGCRNGVKGKRAKERRRRRERERAGGGKDKIDIHQVDGPIEDEYSVQTVIWY